MMRWISGVAVMSLSLLAVVGCRHKDTSEPSTTSDRRDDPFISQAAPAAPDRNTQNLARVRDASTQAADPRLLPPRTLYQGSGFTPPASREAWTQRARELREQTLLAAGLWPLPPKCELDSVVHGRIDRDGYSVEKVYFQSLPGFYVSGNLYRPKGKPGPFPAVLCPHGHWNNGRFYEATQKEVDAQLKDGTELNPEAARYPLQARCANLAKLGCIVFHYDMVGYADADPERFPHRKIFLDADSQLRGLTIFGLQTWDSIRALDFVASLPDVDKSRLACTGASGGGTQTFVLMAIEDRLAAAAPVCMISAGDHQGGCVCENAPYLRLGTDNVELSSTFAPRPFVHPTATGDWTKNYLEQGYPQTRAVYKLFGAEAHVHAMRQTAGHNYNMRSREAVYNWFNQHLKLGHPGPVVEQKFSPLPPSQLSVFDSDHPRPANAATQESLKKYWREISAQQSEALLPHDGASYVKFESLMRPALKYLLATDLPRSDDVRALRKGLLELPGRHAEKLLLSRASDASGVPALWLTPPRSSDTVDIVLLPDGKAGLLGAEGLYARGHAVLGLDVFLTGEYQSGEKPVPAPDANKEFFTGYNRTVLGNRVHDVLTAVAWARSQPGIKRVNLIGVGRTGVWAALAGALAGERVASVEAELNAFDFDQVKDFADENYLPCVLRTGGAGPLLALNAPHAMTVRGASAGIERWLKAAYASRGAAGRLRFEQ